jgi:hypothetical protein
MTAPVTSSMAGSPLEAAEISASFLGAVDMAQGSAADAAASPATNPLPANADPPAASTESAPAESAPAEPAPPAPAPLPSLNGIWDGYTRPRTPPADGPGGGVADPSVTPANFSFGDATVVLSGAGYIATSSGIDGLGRSTVQYQAVNQNFDLAPNTLEIRSYRIVDGQVADVSAATRLSNGSVASIDYHVNYWAYPAQVVLNWPPRNPGSLGTRTLTDFFGVSRRPGLNFYDHVTPLVLGAGAGTPGSGNPDGGPGDGVAPPAGPPASQTYMPSEQGAQVSDAVANAAATIHGTYWSGWDGPPNRPAYSYDESPGFTAALMLAAGDAELTNRIKAAIGTEVAITFRASDSKTYTFVDTARLDQIAGQYGVDRQKLLDGFLAEEMVYKQVLQDENLIVGLPADDAATEWVNEYDAALEVAGSAAAMLADPATAMQIKLLDVTYAGPLYTMSVARSDFTIGQALIDLGLAPASDTPAAAFASMATALYAFMGDNFETYGARPQGYGEAFWSSFAGSRGSPVTYQQFSERAASLAGNDAAGLLNAARGADPNREIANPAGAAALTSSASAALSSSYYVPVDQSVLPGGATASQDIIDAVESLLGFDVSAVNPNAFTYQRDPGFASALATSDYIRDELQPLIDDSNYVYGFAISTPDGSVRAFVNPTGIDGYAAELGVSVADMEKYAVANELLHKSGFTNAIYQAFAGFSREDNEYMSSVVSAIVAPEVSFLDVLHLSSYADVPDEYTRSFGEMRYCFGAALAKLGLAQAGVDGEAALDGMLDQFKTYLGSIGRGTMPTVDLKGSFTNFLSGYAQSFGKTVTMSDIVTAFADEFVSDGRDVFQDKLGLYQNMLGFNARRVPGG